jgi:hypothetical protein
MSNEEFSNFKRILFTTVLGVLISAGGTALAFYYSTTSRLNTIESSVHQKMDKQEFEYFKKNCNDQEQRMTKQFNTIEKKLERIENAIYRIAP